jgi:hypothetical protein
MCRNTRQVSRTKKKKQSINELEFLSELHHTIHLACRMWQLFAAFGYNGGGYGTYPTPGIGIDVSEIDLDPQALRSRTPC